MKPNELAKALLTEKKLVIPTDVYVLANDLGYKVHELNFMESSNEVIQRAETITFCNHSNFYTPTIVINSILNPLKKRFVLAREIGRVRLFMSKRGIKSISDLKELIFDYNTKPNSTDHDTIAAECFAFELLMPENQVFLFYNTLSTPYLELFIDKFKLSIVTIEDRLNQLGLRFVK